MKHKIAALFLPLLLTGCTFNTGIDTLLSPPKLSKQQQLIYDALINYTGENISLKYPKAGKNLSAFIIEDIDGDKQDEAIVFYKKNAAKSEDDSLRINILDSKKNDEDIIWHSVYDHAADGNDIEQVEVARLGDNNRINIIAGYSLINKNEKKISIYDYSEGKLNTNLSNQSYSVFKTEDFNGDGSVELLTATGKTTSRDATAVMYHLYDTGEYKQSEVTLKDSYLGYKNIVSDNTSNEEINIFLDAEIGNGNVVTEVLKADLQNNLRIVFSPELEKNETVRTSAYLSADIDGDGSVEIPVLRYCDGYDENSQNPLYFTSWYDVVNKELIHKYESFCSINDGYNFIIPRNWYGKITAKAYVADNEIAICSGSSYETAEEIFKIKVASEKEISKISEDDGYTLIRTRGDKHFFLKINDKNPLALKAEELIMKFKFEN